MKNIQLSGGTGNRTANNTMPRLFSIYIWFTLLFYSISFFGGGIKFREHIPWYVLISRDLVWLGLLAFMGYRTYRNSSWQGLWTSGSGQFLKIFAASGVVYLAIVLSHMPYRYPEEIIQHDIRNILSYSLVLVFLPLIVQKREDLSLLLDTFLKSGIVISLFGILTRFSGIDILTWRGRIVSTMSDPNNLGIFLVFVILLNVALWGKLGSKKGTLYFLIFSFALVLTNSVTAFLTVNFALFIMLISRKGWLKGAAVSLAVFYLFIALSFASKVVENPTLKTGNFITETYNTDKYLVDRLDNISQGMFSRWVLAGMDFPSKSPIRSLVYREAQLKVLLEALSEPTILVGNYESKTYVTFDNQYMNFIINSGIVSAVIFFGMFLWGALTGLKSYFVSYKKGNNLAVLSLFFSVFLLSVTLVAFNGLAFLNRFPLNLLMYFSLGMVFLLRSMEKQNSSGDDKTGGPS